MKKIKIGILGCNYMGKMHADCYGAIEGVEIVAVADLNEETAKNVAGRYGSKVYTDAKRLIEETELDAVDICLPTFLHAQYATLAMDRGIPYLFIEKPVALNQEECALLLQKQKETGCRVQVGQVIRFWDEYVYLKKLFDEKMYGDVVNASFKRLSPSPTWSSNNWMKNTKLSGGAIVDLHIHDIDYMLYLFGEPKKSSYVKNIRGEHNSYITTVCEYENFVVSVEGTWFLPPSYPFNMYYRVVFEKAVVEYDKGKVTVYDENGSFTPSIEKSAAVFGDFEGGNISEQSGYINELTYFIDCIKMDKEIERARLCDGARSLAFILDELK